jgi:hypothetical protein
VIIFHIGRSENDHWSVFLPPDDICRIWMFVGYKRLRTPNVLTMGSSVKSPDATARL